VLLRNEFSAALQVKELAGETCMKLFTDPRMQKAFAMWKKQKS
jgi:hypothetical protein